jgi:hypothetical protein
MKNIVKLLVVVLLVTTVYKSFAIGPKFPEELSCKNNIGIEVSIGNGCSRGGDSCVDSYCPRGTIAQQL